MTKRDLRLPGSAPHITRCGLHSPGISPDYYDIVRGIYSGALVAYYPLDDTSGDTAHDHSGNGLHGLILGAQLGVPGIGDGRPAMYFDGIDDYIDIFSAQFVNLFSTRQGAVSCWFTCVSSGGYAFFTDSGSSANSVYVWVNVARYTVNYRMSNIIQQWQGPSVVSCMTHIACSWDYPNNRISFYMNGVYAPGTPVMSGLATAGAALTRARIGRGNSVYLQGIVAHVAIWNRALTPEQIKNLGPRALAGRI